MLSAVPPWLLPQPIVDLSLLKRLHSMKDKINVQAYVNTVLHEQYGQFIQIFTDGSKNPENGQTSCAFYVPELKVKVGKRTSDHIAVYTVEMMAISLALQWIEEVQPMRVVICSDSSAALESINNFVRMSSGYFT